MARREENYHYYFYTNNGVTVIVAKTVALPMFIYSKKGYVELTDEQVSFYLANPTASVEEIKICEIEQYQGQDSELEMMKTSTIDEIRIISMSYIENYSNSNNVTIAIASRICIQNMWLTQSNCAFTTDECKDKIKNYVSYCKDVINVLNTSISTIQNSQSIQEVQEVSDNFKQQLNNL